jgi:hypothetical protein
MKNQTPIRYIERCSYYWCVREDFTVLMVRTLRLGNQRRSVIVADGAPDYYVDVCPRRGGFEFFAEASKLHETEGDAYRAIAKEFQERAEEALEKATEADETDKEKGIYIR